MKTLERIITTHEIESHIMKLCIKKAEAWAGMLQMELKVEPLLESDPHSQEATEAVLEYHRHRRTYESTSRILRSYPKDLVERHTH